MRKLVLSIAVVSAIVVPSGAASATEIPLPTIGGYGCQVSLGTVGVIEPEGIVTYDGFYVNPYFCLPPV